MWYLFNKIYGRLKVQTEIYEDPLNPFSLVLFLLKYKHVVIEKLLQFLVREIDTQLVKTVHLSRVTQGSSETQKKEYKKITSHTKECYTHRHCKTTSSSQKLTRSDKNLLFQNPDHYISS
jgi:hypothetical protein